MKKQGVIFIMVAVLLLTGITTASAAYYTIDFDETAAVSSASDTFIIDDFSSIDSAILSFTIKGMKTSGDWIFDSVVDIYSGSTSRIDENLADTWTTIDLGLNTASIASMETDDAASFSIQGQDVIWYNTSNWYQMQRPSRFYLDEATLNVTTSPVPVPGGALLLGSGLN